MRLLLLGLCAFLFLTPPSPAQDAYKVALWNVQNYGVTDRFIDGKRVPAAMKPDAEVQAMVAILKRIDADILGLVEIIQDPEDKYLRGIRELLKKNGLDYPYYATCRGEDTRIQTLLLSRFPILREDHVTDATYNTTIKDGKSGATKTVLRRMERGINQAIIQIRPGIELRTMLIHLKSKRAFPEVVSDIKDEPGDGFIRRNEALIVRGTMIRALQANPTERILLMGDFNDTIRSRALSTILGSRGDTHRVFDLWLRDWLGDWWTHFYLPEQTYARIDYMIASQQLFSEWDRERSYVYRQREGDGPEFNPATASDHRPLVAVFTIPPPAPPPARK
jgi:endonuclease/exonuclease/phosphatase family metal-dependent hydrolase